MQLWESVFKDRKPALSLFFLHAEMWMCAGAPAAILGHKVTLEMATRHGRATKWNDPKSPTQPWNACRLLHERERHIQLRPWVFCYLYSNVIFTDTEGLASGQRDHEQRLRGTNGYGAFTGQ